MINGCALTKSKIFLICCLAVILGVGAASFLPAKWLVYDLWLFGGVMFGLVIAIFFWKNIKFRLVGLVILFLFLGIWRYAIGMPADTPDKIWHYNGENFSFVGIVADEPDVRENSIKYKVESKKFKNSNASKNDFINVSGLVLVTADLYPTYKYGDELEVACQLRAPEEFSGFAYDKYLARYDIYSVCYYPQITKLDINQSDCLYAKIFKIKDKLRTAINRGLPEPSAGLARAIVLGDKRAINDDLRVVFSRAGISHIVAISGMHISFLAVIVMGLLLWLGLARKPAVWAASLILFIYLLLIGLPASAMRAGLMGFLVMFALSVGRLNRLTNALVLTAAILLLINPRLLRDDIGFQLSFLAVIGIAFVYPLISQWRYKINQPWMKRVFRFKPLEVIFDIFAITLAAQALTLPIIAANFSQVSVIAPITNLLVLWSLPFVIMVILGGLGLSLLIPSLAILFFLPAKILLDYVIFIAEKLARLPYAYFEINYVWPVWWGLYYIIMAWLIFRFKSKKRKKNF